MKFFRRIGIEFIGLGLDGDPAAGIGPAAVALGDEALDADLARGRQQMVGTHRPQPVAACEGAIEVPQVGRSREIRHLVNNGIGPRGDNGRANGHRVETVGDDGFGPHAPDGFRLRRGAGQAHDRMTCRDQCGDERAADGAGGACNEDSHGVLLLFVTPRSSGLRSIRCSVSWRASPRPKESSQSGGKGIPRQSTCRDPRGSGTDCPRRRRRRERKKGAPWARLFR